MDPHQQISRFLRGQPVLSLTGASGQAGFHKAGIVPFLRMDGQHHYFVMKPRAKRPDLPPPEFQLCKGTRMTYAAGAWCDMADGAQADSHAETLAQTALREGMEEIGLVLENILALYDIGPYDFASAASGKGKKMWVFAAQMDDAERFTVPDSSTQECAWMTLSQFAIVGRPDHHYILAQIESQLKEHAHSPR